MLKNIDDVGYQIKDTGELIVNGKIIGTIEIADDGEAVFFFPGADGFFRAWTIKMIASILDKWNDQDSELLAIESFIERVNRRAEETIKKSNMVSGAHWNAMQVELELLKGRNYHAAKTKL